MRKYSIKGYYAGVLPIDFKNSFKVKFGKESFPIHQDSCFGIVIEKVGKDVVGFKVVKPFFGKPKRVLYKEYATIQ